MITNRELSTVYLASLLKRKAPSVAAGLEQILERHRVPLRWIDGTNDIWCRDFMPVWVSETECVQFVFDPKYYKSAKYQSWRTEPLMITPRLGLWSYFCDIVLDGGNIVNSRTTAICTDRIFEDNPKWCRERLVDTLRQHLQVERLVIVPELPKDSTGHIDGMVRFVNEDTVLLNNLSGIITLKQYSHIWMCLQNAGLRTITVPCALANNKSYDDATGDYINFLEVGDLIVVPGYGTDIDGEVLDLISGVFPGRIVEQLDISELTPHGGGLNCVSWCQPLEPSWGS